MSMDGVQKHADDCAIWLTEDGWHHPDCDCERGRRLLAEQSEVEA